MQAIGTSLPTQHWNSTACAASLTIESGGSDVDGLFELAAMARHARDRSGRLANRFVPPAKSGEWLHLFYRQQYSVGAVGLSQSGVRADRFAILFVCDEPARVSQEC